jgi:SAM-dependent MidA family methyltransferase
MSELKSIIRQDILSAGSISFARFMELALYCPKTGYYEQESSMIGKKGDFYTSVSVGPLFGELLARKFTDWLESFAAQPAILIEAGAHDGQLALDILTWVREFRPELAVNYWIVEPSERRRIWQESKLDFFADNVTWFASLDALPRGLCGVIFCNELLDAMPVHILQWKGGGWVELRIGLKENALVWQTAELTTDLAPPQIPSGLAAVLPDGFQIEVSPAARNWWRGAAAKLQRGTLVTIDYGLEQDELWAPHRRQGTIRAYYRHHLTDDLLARPGEQDLTAHVSFTDVRRAGEEAGLITDGLVSQSKFLTDIAAGMPTWTAERVRQFQTLTHPEHLGRSFKVLIQSR